MKIRLDINFDKSMRNKQMKSVELAPFSARLKKAQTREIIGKEGAEHLVRGNERTEK